MTVTLVATDALVSELMDAAALSIESGGVLLASPVHTPSGDLRLLARSIHWVPDHAYECRESEALRITSQGFVPALALATHPGDGSSPRPSRRDRLVDDELSELFRTRTNCEFYGALVVAHRDGHLRFTGHMETDDAKFDIDRLWSVGDRFVLTHNADHPQNQLPEMFDRNVHAFGGDIQRVFGDLRVGVVGCGGTGSAVTEQLVRLGVRDFVLIDADVLSASNVTRVYGSSLEDVGRPKVEVASAQISRIAPDATITALQSMVNVEYAARALVDCDVVFGCTDDNAGRLVLSRLATYLLLPVIDCGVLLTSDDGHLVGIDGRVTLLVPGSACLICRGRIDLARAATELLTPEERVRRVDEGYAPAVIVFTTAVAAAAVGELLERLTRFGPDPVPSEILLRLQEREISTNIRQPGGRHYCDADAGKHGTGDTEPFLDQTWPN
jgi:molybdopterin/thiamine biosynthesis adenylyltransferase